MIIHALGILRPGGAARFVPCVWKGIGRWMASQPAWWKKGWPRERVDSMAEAELLSQLAVMLKPRTQIRELFRRFPAPEGWGGNYLDPDLSVYGVLRKRNAALFVEYDGYWRHSEKEGLAADYRKNVALLSYAPPGSRIVRIGHWDSKPHDQEANVLWITVDQWSFGSQKSISKVLRCVLLQILAEFGGHLHPSVAKRLQKLAEREQVPASARSLEFMRAAATTAGGSSKEELLISLLRCGLKRSDAELLADKSYLLRLSSENQVKPVVCCLLGLGLSSTELMKVAILCPKILKLSAEKKLKPAMKWFLDLGLTKNQVAKAVATHPPILWLSIKQNLKPTVQWFFDLGMTKSQVAKAVATSPRVLGCSIEKNLKPTVQWFLDLGLTKRQVAKAVATHPRMLGYSVEQNLKPTVQWFLDLGLTKNQVAKAVATHPPILWLSIEQNLEPTVQWFLDLGLTKRQVAKAVATHPRMLGYSIEQNLEPTVQWFLDLGLTKSQVAKVVATFSSILSLSIEQNLKPTVQWFLDLGLTKGQVAKAAATHPPILSFSIRENLNPKMKWLSDVGLSRRQLASAVVSSPIALGLNLENNLKNKVRLMHLFLTQEEVVRLLASFLPIFHYRYQRLKERLTILALQNKTSQVASAMSLTDEKFSKRYK